MIKSMTGYGRVEGIFENKKVLAEIKSVNHRYADFNIKTPRHYGFMEEKVRKYVSGFVSRGKIDVYLSMESYNDTDKQITVNLPLAASYIEALTTLKDEFALSGEASI